MTKGIFFCKMSRLALGFTLPYQRIPEVVCQAVKWQGHEASHSPLSSGKLKKHGFTFPLSIRLHGVVFH
jgi:hypothetical protein